MGSTNDSGFFDFVLDIPVLPTVPKNVSKVISTSANSSASNLKTSENNDQNSENNDPNSENKEQKSENNEYKSENKEQNSENNEQKSENNEQKSENNEQKSGNKKQNPESNEQNSVNKEENFKNKEQNSENNEQNSGNNELNCPFCHEEQSLDTNHSCEKYQNALSQKNCSLCHLNVEEGFMKKHLEFDCKITKLFGVKKALSFQIGNSALKSEILQNSEKSKILQNSEEPELLQNSSESSNPPLIIKEVYSLGTIDILRNHFQGQGGSKDIFCLLTFSK